MATIKDVAKLANVSPGTISRYLNGVHVKEKNRIPIENAIEELGFQPNIIARTLRTNRTNTIGVVIPNFSDIYSMIIVKNIESDLYQKGYNIFLCDSCGDMDTEIQKVKLLMQKMVDGLIIYPCSCDISYINSINENHIPIVTIDLGIKNYQCDQVLTDNVNATYTAVEWLINHNHKRIGIIGGSPDYFTSAERIKGYMRVMEDYGVDIDKQLIKSIDFSERTGYDSLVSLMKLEYPPTAVVTCNYYTTLGAVKAIYELKLKIPKELSLIGFDNLGLSEITNPPLSVIAQPMEGMGKRAAELILKRIHGDYEDFPVVSRLKTDLVLRRSTRGIG